MRFNISLSVSTKEDGFRNGNRRLLIWNDSTAVLFVNLVTTVSSATNYTVQIAAQGTYTVPSTWTGMVRGIWAAANGFARVTELS